MDVRSLDRIFNVCGLNCDQEQATPEAEVDEPEAEAEAASTRGRTSLLSVLAVCSFTDVYNSYQRREARRRPPPPSDDPNPETGSSLTAEVDKVDADRKRSSTPTSSDGAVVREEDELAQLAPPTDNGVYPLAAR